MKQIIATAFIALSLLLTPSAIAQQTPELKSSVLVNDGLVTLGDLFKNAGVYAEIAVFRAPEPGKSGSVSVGRIKQAAQRHGMPWNVSNKISKVRVTRNSTMVTRDMVENVIADEIMSREHIEARADLKISYYGRTRPLHLDANASGKMEILSFEYRNKSGDFKVVLKPEGVADSAIRMTVRGRATEYTEKLVAARAMPRGHVVQKSDLMKLRVEKRRADFQALNDVESIIGMSLTRSMRANQAIRPGDVTEPVMVNQHALVTIRYKSPGLVLTAQGKALSDAALGDIVNVVNTRSNRTVHAVVTGRNQVEVNSLNNRKVAQASAN